MEEEVTKQEEPKQEDIASIEVVIRYTTPEGKSSSRTLYPSTLKVDETNRGIIGGEATFDFTITGTYSVFIGNPGSLTLKVTEQT